MKPTFVLLVALTAAPAFAQEQKRPNPYESVFVQASKLKLKNPVTAKQASILSQAYAYRYITGCGGARKPIDKGSYWLIPTVVGFAAHPGPEIRVDKKTGVVQAPKLPKVTDPKSFAPKQK